MTPIVDNILHTRFLSAALIVLALSAFGCETHFDPLRDNGRYRFSIHGYLDASADTQWVRVMPVREELTAEPGPIDAVVTLEDITGGTAAEMNDSLFAFADGRFAHNFWTPMELQPGHRYRLTAESSDGSFSRAETSLPADFPTPRVSIELLSTLQPIPVKATVIVEGVGQIADVRTVYNDLYLSHLQDTLRRSSGDIHIVMDPREDFQSLVNYAPEASLLTFLSSSSPYEPRIFIAAAGPDYRYFGSVDDKIIALPEGVSNVENGLGYLGGILSKTIPYKSCTEETSTDIVPCPLEPPPW